jgi:hypothetical protein
MFRIILILLIAVILVPCLLAQVPKVDSLFLIPCGPLAGTFSSNARITVNDTIAGWAKIQVEGWIPVTVALPFMKAPLDTVNTVLPNITQPAEKEASQCEAITKKGVRCSRKAKEGSKYCWQHQSYNPSDQ